MKNSGESTTKSCARLSGSSAADQARILDCLAACSGAICHGPRDVNAATSVALLSDGPMLVQVFMKQGD